MLGSLSLRRALTVSSRQQGRFLQHVCWEFKKRQTEEERSDCKTPLEWRLTPAIRREFVKTMRTVALLSMFSRDPLTIANSQAALKTMGFLEPDLIFPAVLERAWPALEGLELVRSSGLRCARVSLIVADSF